MYAVSSAIATLTGEAATAPCDVKASAELVVVVAVADGVPAKYLARPWLRSSGSVYGLSIDTGKLILVVTKEACVASCSNDEQAGDSWTIQGKITVA